MTQFTEIEILNFLFADIGFGILILIILYFFARLFKKSLPKK